MCTIVSCARKATPANMAFYCYTGAKHLLKQGITVGAMYVHPDNWPDVKEVYIASGIPYNKDRNGVLWLGRFRVRLDDRVGLDEVYLLSSEGVIAEADYNDSEHAIVVRQLLRKKTQAKGAKSRKT